MEAYYLPSRLLAVVETVLARRSPTARGRILTFEEIMGDGIHRPALMAIDLTLIFHVSGAKLEKPVYYCVIDTPAMNAMVASFTSFYCIVYNSGLYQQLYPILGGLLTHEPLRNFLMTGEAPVDDRSASRISRREAYGILRSSGADMATTSSLNLTFLFAELMIGMVTCHELGHLFGGHLGSSSGPWQMSEAPIQNDRFGRNRSLEIDADIFGALACALLTTRLSSTSAWAALKLDHGKKMRFLFTAAYIMFSAMDYFGVENPLVTKKAHPAPLTRVFIMGMTVSNTLIHLVPEADREGIWNEASASVRAIEIAMLDTVGGAMMPDEALRYEAVAQGLWAEHMNRWPTVKATLDRSRLSVFPWAIVLP
jgi:hypothetical protein